MSYKQTTHKVGILPYRAGAEGLEFLIHLPRAKNPQEQDSMRWGLARGTVQHVGGEDLRSMRDINATAPEAIEDHEATALREMQEELGLQPGDLVENSLQSHGLLEYTSQEKGTYPIHFFTVQVRQGVSAASLKAKAEDAQDLAWCCLETIKEWADHGQFKASYIPVIEQIDAQIIPSRGKESPRHL